MFIAIISDAYEEVQGRISSGVDKVDNTEIRDYLYSNFAHMPIVGWFVRTFVQAGKNVKLLIQRRKMSPEERQYCVKLFNKFDFDKSGKISPEEAKMVLLHLNPA